LGQKVYCPFGNKLTKSLVKNLPPPKLCIVGAKFGAKSVSSFWQQNDEIFGQKFTASKTSFGF
jgi:hypothetical protein